ncbi:maestro heat-like repeat-containing protein family member 2A [Elgaria multicarinata webbii]|uniref:maestro heat-like repeat-containing protein family member 2A n=1 Tax=Elgaria multicarinata webbii TaxID=159646 RepID=UPI002FCD628B
MAEEGSPSGEGGPCPISRLLQSPEAASQKEAVLRIVRAARSQPAAVMPALAVMLQRDKAPAWQKVAVYRSLRAMVEHGLQVEPACDFIVAASKQLRASPEPDAPRELQAAASNTLTTLARHHFNPIMTELQQQLRPFAEPDEFTLLTLGKIAAGNVYSCVPFLGITLTTLQTVMRCIEDSQRRKALCTALEQMCRAIRTYLRTWERSSYPRVSVQQFSAYLLPLYACITRTWLPGSDSQVKLAALKALGPMLSILLPRTEFQAQIYGDIELLLAEYESGINAFHVTKILGQILEASLVNSNPIPRTQVELLARTLTRQICSSGQKGQPPRQEHSEENRAEISQIFLRLARSHPSELLWVFQGKLEDVREEPRVVLLALLAEIVAAQLPELWSRRQLCVKALKAVLGDERTRVRLATLRTIENLLRTGYLEKVEGWPLNYIALQLSISAHQLTHPTLRLRLGGLEEKAVERASAEALQVAVASGRGASQELWVRMLGYVTQPHYAASATPLCRALRQLAEQRLRQVVHGQDGWEPVNSPTAQELMACLLVSAVGPWGPREVGVPLR